MSKERDGKELGWIDQLPRAVYHYGQPDQVNHNTAGKSPELWPTPVANDDNKTPEAHLAMKQRMGGNRTAITSLNVKVKAESSNWATPAAKDQEGYQVDSQGKRWPKLGTQVKENWRTPSDPSKRGGSQPASKRKQGGHTINLEDQVHTQGKLNADWVESLMNVPLGWTQLPLSWVTESTDSGCSVMELFQQQHPRLLQRSTTNLQEVSND